MGSLNHRSALPNNIKALYKLDNKSDLFTTANLAYTIDIVLLIANFSMTFLLTVVYIIYELNVEGISIK